MASTPTWAFSQTPTEDSLIREGLTDEERSKCQVGKFEVQEFWLSNSDPCLWGQEGGGGEVNLIKVDFRGLSQIRRNTIVDAEYQSPHCESYAKVEGGLALEDLEIRRHPATTLEARSWAGLQDRFKSPEVLLKREKGDQQENSFIIAVGANCVLIGAKFDPVYSMGQKLEAEQLKSLISMAMTRPPAPTSPVDPTSLGVVPFSLWSGSTPTDDSVIRAGLQIGYVPNLPNMERRDQCDGTFQVEEVWLSQLHPCYWVGAPVEVTKVDWAWLSHSSLGDSNDENDACKTPAAWGLAAGSGIPAFAKLRGPSSVEVVKAELADLNPRDARSLSNLYNIFEASSPASHGSLQASSEPIIDSFVIALGASCKGKGKATGTSPVYISGGYLKGESFEMLISAAKTREDSVIRAQLAKGSKGPHAPCALRFGVESFFLTDKHPDGWDIHGKNQKLVTLDGVKMAGKYLSSIEVLQDRDGTETAFPTVRATEDINHVFFEFFDGKTKSADGTPVETQLLNVLGKKNQILQGEVNSAFEFLTFVILVASSGIFLCVYKRNPDDRIICTFTQHKFTDVRLGKEFFVIAVRAICQGDASQEVFFSGQGLAPADLETLRQSASAGTGNGNMVLDNHLDESSSSSSGDDDEELSSSSVDSSAVRSSSLGQLGNELLRAKGDASSADPYSLWLLEQSLWSVFRWKYFYSKRLPLKRLGATLSIAVS